MFRRSLGYFLAIHPWSIMHSSKHLRAQPSTNLLAFFLFVLEAIDIPESVAISSVQQELMLLAHHNDEQDDKQICGWHDIQV